MSLNVRILFCFCLGLVRKCGLNWFFEIISEWRWFSWEDFVENIMVFIIKELEKVIEGFSLGRVFGWGG